MHPGFMWWASRRGACRGEAFGEGRFGEGRDGGFDAGFQWAGGRGGPGGHGGPPWGRGHGPGGHEDGFGDLAGGAFGVRRPLRFLAYKLDLNEEQVAELARVLDELKTERAQAAVDDRRTTGALADAVAGEAFDEAAATNAAKARVDSAERLKAAVVRALGRLHAVLEPEQRKKLGYLLRTGVLGI